MKIIEKIKEKFKKWQVKRKIHNTTRKIKVFYENHEEEIWITSAVVLPAAVGGVKAVSKAYSAGVEERHRKLTVYDPSVGHYNQLKRELSSSDWERILNMKRELNITLTECLIRLNLVK